MLPGSTDKEDFVIELGRAMQSPGPSGPSVSGLEHRPISMRCGSGPGRQREQTTEAVTSLRDLENARVDALQLALWDAAMTGGIGAAVAAVKIGQARVHLSGLEQARDGLGGMPATPRTLIVPADV